MGNDLGIIPGRGCAGVRLAEALLRSLGATQVTLRLSDASTGDTSSQLGLEPPTAEDLPISPALLRPLTPANDGRRRVEVIIGAASLRAIAKTYGVQDIAAWLLGMQGVLLHDEVMRIATVTVDQFAGADCLYHLTATE